MIAPIKHDKLTKYSLSLLTPPSIGLIKILVNIADGGLTNLYPNKQLKIKTDNGIILSGFLIFTDDEKYFVLNNPLLTGNEYINSAIYFETFTVSEDNELVTINDIQKLLDLDETNVDKYENDTLVSKGQGSLINGKQVHKIKTIKYEQTYVDNEFINFSTAVFTKIGQINIPKYTEANNYGKFETFEHVFILSSNLFNAKIQIKVPNFDNPNEIYNQFQINILEYSTSDEYKNIDLILKVSRKYSVTNDNKNYLLIEGKFDTSKLSNVSPIDNRIIHFVKNYNDVFFDDVVTENTLSYTYNKNLIGNSPVFSNEFIINYDIIKYNFNGVYKYSLNELNIIKISEGSNLNSYINPGNYYFHNGNFSSISNKPTPNNLRFNLDVINLNIDNTNYETSNTWLLQRYTCYQTNDITNNLQIGIFERVSTIVNNNLTWSPWIETCKKVHTHQASDIIENSNKRFVTDTNINNWNSVYNNSLLTFWKPSVLNESQLSTVYPSANIGWSAYVQSTKSIWSFDGDNWINQNSVSSDIENGIITKEQHQEFFTGASMDKKIPNKESYQNRLTENPTNVYGNDYIFIQNNHIDKVKRTTTVLQQLKEYAIQEGWNVNVYGGNSFVKGKDINSLFDFSIGTGTGLEFNNDNQTIFGRYNEINPDILFAVGDGLDNDNRHNLFSVDNNGVFKAAGFSIPNGTTNDILLGDGYKISKLELIDEIVEGLGQAGTEIIVVPENTENYILPWTTIRKTKFGKFGKFDIFLKNSENIYSKQEVPIKLNTEINAISSELEAVSYTFTLTNIEAIILIS